MFLRTLLLVHLLAALSNAQVSQRPTQCNLFIYERLRNYFDINELRPVHVINNDWDLGRWESHTQTLSIGNQKVEWIEEVEARSWKITVRINGDDILLSDESSTNAPEGDVKLPLSVVGEWNQIKLFRIGDQTVIGITMGPRQCTGLMCGIGVQLWYDVRSKRKTFFAAYRSDSSVRLIQAKEKVYTVTTNFHGDPHGVTSPAIMRYELYRLDSTGRFEQAKDQGGRPYFIKHTQYPAREFRVDRISRKKPAKADSLEQNWIENVLGPEQ
jgi:hypothetical protein